MRIYTQLSLEEREKLYSMHNSGMSLRRIGKTLCRSHSSLSRELRRNTKVEKSLGYLPDTAHAMAQKRKASHGRKISRYPWLTDYIINRMREGCWSPEMIAGRLKHDKSVITLSHEAIYQYIYSETGMKQLLYQHLMCRRPKRNQTYGRKTRRYGIKERISISQRTIESGEFGHFEADTTFFKGSRSINLLTMVERKTGFFMADLQPTKNSEQTSSNLLNNLIKFPRKSRKSLTMDNGKEFACHTDIRDIAKTPTFFCHPGSPWEKPYVETIHALLHRFIPKNTNPKSLTKQEVQHAVTHVNNLPRKRFNFRTPAEMLSLENLYRGGALRP